MRISRFCRPSILAKEGLLVGKERPRAKIIKNKKNAFLIQLDSSKKHFVALTARFPILCSVLLVERVQLFLVSPRASLLQNMYRDLRIEEHALVPLPRAFTDWTFPYCKSERAHNWDKRVL